MGEGAKEGEGDTGRKSGWVEGWKGKGGKGKENGEGRKRMPGQGRKCVGGGKRRGKGC